MRQKILGFLGAVLVGISCFAGVLTVSGATAESAWAVEVSAGGKDNCGSTLLGFRPWYYTGKGSLFKICVDGEVKPPSKDDADAVTKFVWTIILNISFDLTLAVGYIAVAMVIYGGYLYIMAQGDPGKAAKGQHTLTSAVVGVVIAMGASVIVNTAQVILGLSGGDGSGSTFLEDEAAVRTAVNNIFPWAYTMAGLVAVVFIIKGGVEYMISRGDPGRVQKATRSLTYAVVGLVIVILAAIITSVIMGAIGEAL